MSDQEMHFADPDWQPLHRRANAPRQASPPPQPVNDASTQPREDDPAWATLHDEQEKVGAGQSAYTPYEEGYRASQQRSGGASSRAGQQTRQQTGQQSRLARVPWLWITLALVVLILLGFSPFSDDALLVIPRVLLLIIILSAITAFLAFIIQRGRPAPVRDFTEIRTFSVGPQPKIIVKDDLGTIHVHAVDEEHQVFVRVTRRSMGLLGNPSSADVQYEQNDEKNRVTIKARTGWHLLGKNSVDVDITVPHLADLDIKTEAGGISVGGVSGQMSLASEAGSVKATGVMLYGDSRLKTDAGSITFSGSLHPSGVYSMTTDAGSVTVTLPAQSAVRIDARTDVGSINSDFPLVVQRDFPGARARGDVGAAPVYPTLKLRTDVGSINVRQA